MPQPFTCKSCLASPTLASSLVRQGILAPSPALSFPLLRRALSIAIPQQVVDGTQPLAKWAAHTDLSSIVPELWAYVGDVLGLYNSAIASETLLQMAQDRRSLRRIAELLGYLPGPAVGSVDEIAAFVARGTFRSSVATSYRASGSGASPAQVMEAANVLKMESSRNEFSLSPILEATVGLSEVDGLLLDPATASPVRGRCVMFNWFNNKIVKQHATEIVNVKPWRSIDGQEYIKFEVVEAPPIDSSVSFQDVTVLSPSQQAYARTKLLGSGAAISAPQDITVGEIQSDNGVLGKTSGGHHGSQNHPLSVDDLLLSGDKQSWLDLDSVYRAISAGDYVLLQYNSYYSAHRVMATLEQQFEVETDSELPGPMIPVTRLRLYPSIDTTKILVDKISPLIVHYNMYDVGRLMRLAHTELTPTLLLGDPLALEGIHDIPTEAPTEFILEDADGRGVLVDGKLVVAANGVATLEVTRADFSGGLRVPVKAYGNVVRVSRGETVKDEVLGDGDQAQPYQSFQLAKSPLTYLPSPGAPRGITTTLEVRVGGVLWHERASFYGAGPDDAVYIVRHDDEQNTTITFGDGVRGMRVHTGSRNVRATYRHGAGAEVPAAGAINQIVKGAPGLLRVRSPIVARLGADAESVRDIRKNLPASALILGRCVSLADYSARVAGLPGLRNSKVEYAWDEASLTAGIKVWYIANDPDSDMSDEIVGDLQAMSEPGLVVRAAAATSVAAPIFINLEIDRDYLPSDIESAVRAALLDPETGLLAVENTPIGGPLSRSALVAVARAVPGVLDVTSVHYGIDAGADSFPAPGLLLGAGEYFDFGEEHAGNLVVGAVHAESRGCRDLVS